MANLFHCGIEKYQIDLQFLIRKIQLSPGVKQMLHECEIVHNMWQEVGKVIKCDINWKSIVLGVKGSSTMCCGYIHIHNKYCIHYILTMG